MCASALHASICTSDCGRPFSHSPCVRCWGHNGRLNADSSVFVWSLSTTLRVDKTTRQRQDTRWSVNARHIQFTEHYFTAYHRDWHWYWLVASVLERIWLQNTIYMVISGVRRRMCAPHTGTMVSSLQDYMHARTHYYYNYISNAFACCMRARSQDGLA